MTTEIEKFLIERLDVSRETIQLLRIYSEELAKWNAKINLVSNSTIDDIWSRHILDSAQLYQNVVQEAKSWVDLGSGAGFPGMVVAILAQAKNQHLKFNLVESDSRKCEFLRHIARKTGTLVIIHNTRVEKVVLSGSEIVSARALSHLSKLLEYAKPLLAESGYCLFLKGSNIDIELEEAAKLWHFNYEKIPSITEPNGVVLQVSNIRHV